MKIFRYIVASAAFVALASCSGNTAGTAAEGNGEAAAVEEAAAVTAEEAVVELAAGTTEIAAADVPTIIDFNAVWCGPCQRFKPVFHKVAEEFKGKALFVSVNTDSCPDIAQKYQIQSIPQIVTVMPDGTATAGPTGYQEEADFKAYVESVVNK
jgi:thioredoxin